MTGGPTGFAAALLAAAFLLQNAAEVRGGGPDLPAPVAARLPGLTARTKVVAVALASVVVCAALAVAWPADTRWRQALLAMIAGALAANAVVQAVASAVQRRVLPGTLTGVVLMLPAALWLLALLPGARLWAMAGIVLTAPLLAVVWAMAWGLTRRRRPRGDGHR